MSIRVKVCGLTRAEDVEVSRSLGASFFGTILHPASPRFVEMERGAALLGDLPRKSRVAVVVEPDSAILEGITKAGYGVVQVHFDPGSGQTLSRKDVPEGLDLWLAPRLRERGDFSEAWVDHADALLIDRYDPNRFGGTGEQGDWALFRELSTAYQGRCDWILAGGLNPENIGRALAETGAAMVDVNSGVESSPGCKDHRLLREFFSRIETG